MKIHSISISYSIVKSKEEKNHMKNIEDDNLCLENEFYINPSDEVKVKLSEKKLNCGRR